MNRSLQLCVILFLFLIVSCSVETPQLEIKQIKEVNHKVILKYSRKLNSFWAIRLPVVIEISNDFSREGKLTSINYLYNNQIGRHSSVYEMTDDVQTRISFKKIETIAPHSKRKLLIYSQHIIDTSTFGDAFFKQYQKELYRTHQDSLLVSSLPQLQKKHPEFLEALMAGDSIELQFLSLDNNFEKPIKIPITW